MTKGEYMRFIRLCAILCCGVWPICASHALAQSARLTIQADKPGHKVSPTLYGIFFEEVNFAGDGGLYAELVRNRSFEDSAQPDWWSLVQRGSARGEIAIDTQQPLSEKNPHSLRLTVKPGGEGRVGVANQGYYGIAVRRGASYRLSLAVRAADGFDSALTVTLESADGRQTYAKTQIDSLTPQWQTFRRLLTAADSDPKARLVVTVTKPGTVWLDMVSLSPEATWKNRPSGLRLDLAEMVAALKPSFVRFPGGCWVEGETVPMAMRWKDTIGDLSDRRTQWNLWRYHSTNGLGFHEYLQWCEDLGAAPLFVVNCGISHKENVPMDKMGPWVQDALDAIEYANGPAESRWGSLRAKAGHPRPFHLKYMEIGNENNFQHDAYQERYPLFYDAIKSRYPEMMLISNERTAKRPSDIVDEHYYDDPHFFINNANRYDGYDRKGPKIYVGEYAVTGECGQGNFWAAIGEAAFMTGMERNSDVVVMASYAPLFANVNHKAWNPDLINFDSSRAFGTPSYYVQQMFSQNRGDVVLPALVERTTSGGIGSGASPTLYVVAGWIEATKEIVIKVVNVTEFAQDTEIVVRGVENVYNEAQTTVLTSDRLADENTLDAPQKVVPAAKTIGSAGKQFRHAFPARSITILRLRTTTP
jgi:alpha-L-arabinofuranosidase